MPSDSLRAIQPPEPCVHEPSLTISHQFVGRDGGTRPGSVVVISAHLIKPISQSPFGKVSRQRLDNRFLHGPDDKKAHPEQLPSVRGGSVNGSGLELVANRVVGVVVVVGEDVGVVVVVVADVVGVVVHSPIPASLILLVNWRPHGAPAPQLIFVVDQPHGVSFPRISQNIEVPGWQSREHGIILHAVST